MQTYLDLYFNRVQKYKRWHEPNRARHRIQQHLQIISHMKEEHWHFRVTWSSSLVKLHMQISLGFVTFYTFVSGHSVFRQPIMFYYCVIVKTKHTLGWILSNLFLLCEPWILNVMISPCTFEALLWEWYVLQQWNCHECEL